ncbi:MAG: low molecular weight protein-tyrosine-phosphatase [Candidatus Binatia bacterium]
MVTREQAPPAPRGDKKIIKVLFVCMGNICRSPTAAAAFRRLVESSEFSDRIVVDSAGTYAYHAGNGADSRATAAARQRGLDLSGHRARKVTEADFDNFDYILAMDRDNYHDLLALRPATNGKPVALFLDYAPELGVDEVPDPYYGGERGFDHVIDLVEAASEGLLADVVTLLEDCERPPH